MENGQINLERKAKQIAIVIALLCVAISVALYFVFNVVFVVVLFVPPLVYYFLKKRERNDSERNYH